MIQLYRTRIARERSTAPLSAGPLRIDLAERWATLHGRYLDLSPLLMKLLQALATHSRQLVTRDQLKQALWPQSDRIDTERRLNTAIRALRAELGDDADEPKYIETVRSHGYRWIAPGTAAPRSRLWMVAAGLVGLLVAAAIFATAGRRSQPAAAPQSLVQAQAALETWRLASDPARLAAAERAIAQAARDAPASPAVQVLRAQAALEGHWDWAAAEQAYEAALELDLSNADARLGMAWLKVNRGDTAGALRDADALLYDSVLTGDRRTDLGWLLIRAGRPDLATSACPAASDDINGLSCAHTALAAVGQLDQARVAAVRLMETRNADGAAIEQVRRLPAEAAYKQFLGWRAQNFLPPDAAHFDRAQLLADAGFREEALDQLARSVAAHERLAVKILSSPSFQMLRSDPRFQALARKVGAAP